MENLLKAVAIVPEEIEFWRHGDVSNSGNTHIGSTPAAAPANVAHWRLACASSRRWKPLPARKAGNWRFRGQVAGTRSPLEGHLGFGSGIETCASVWKASLWKWKTYGEAIDDRRKAYAPRADVAQWTKAKNRVHNAVPKLKEVIHRSTWRWDRPKEAA